MKRILAITALSLLAGCIPPGPAGDTLRETNARRGTAQVPGVTWSGNLANDAVQHSIAMRNAGVIFHEDVTQEVRKYNGYFTTCGENTAAIPAGASPQTLVNDWMNSSTHRYVLLYPSFTEGGVGWYQSGVRIWVTEYLCG